MNTPPEISTPSETRDTILIADDQEEVRRAVMAAVREVLPGFHVEVFESQNPIIERMNAIGDSVFLVITDGKIGFSHAEEMVALEAVEKGIPHVIYYSKPVEVRNIDDLKAHLRTLRPSE